MKKIFEALRCHRRQLPAPSGAVGSNLGTLPYRNQVQQFSAHHSQVSQCKERHQVGSVQLRRILRCAQDCHCAGSCTCPRQAGHAKELLVALLGGAGCRDDSGLRDRAFAHQKRALDQVRVDGIDNRHYEVLLFGQATAFQTLWHPGRTRIPDRCRRSAGWPGCRAARPRYRYPTAKSSTAPYHTRGACALPPWAADFDCSWGRAARSAPAASPRCHHLDLVQESITPCDLLFGDVLEFGKARLAWHRTGLRTGESLV
jgi:hypothetical protein